MAESWSLCSGAGSAFHVDGPETAKLHRLRVMVRLGLLLGLGIERQCL